MAVLLAGLEPNGGLICESNSNWALAESIPMQMELDRQNGTYDTFLALMHLIGSARHSIDIACFYMTLSNKDQPYPEGHGQWKGAEVLKTLREAVGRGIRVRVVQNEPSKYMPGTDTVDLAKAGVEVRSANFVQLFGAGILHTKFVIVDGKHFYVGSSNMDWRSFSQVKELGFVSENCTVLANDLAKIFSIYWDIGNMTQLPSAWPAAYQTAYNFNVTATLRLGGDEAQFVIASAPPQLCPEGREFDLNALLYLINNAQRSICVSVMDYIPTTLYTSPRVFWPVIDDALRTAAFNRQVDVRLLISKWDHSDPDMFDFLASTSRIPNIHAKVFVVPPLQNVSKQIPFTRVNHAKYMICDDHVYVGTSNWSADYFVWTGGVSLVTNQKGMVDSVKYVFERDWHSQYASWANTTSLDVPKRRRKSRRHVFDDHEELEV